MINMILNALLIAVREIRRNLTRSFLTVIGIVIGVAAVITMVTLGRGATAAIKNEISKIGSNLFILRPGQSRWSWGAPQFTIADVQAIRDQVPGIAGLAPFVQTSVTAIHQDNDFNADIQGTTPDYFPIANWELSAGSFFTEEDVALAHAVCVIGETVRKELFGPGADPVGETIRVGSSSAVVVGVTAPKGQGGFGDDLDDNIIMPYTSVVRRLTGHQDGRFVSQVMISGEDGGSGPHLIADISSLLRERRNITSNRQDNFNVFDSQQLADVISSSTQVMTSLLGAVAGVSLLVGGIGIMNIMLVSVTERTREIGIRLAIGARAREVLLQFLVEAVTLSCIGGAAGIILAYFLCHTLSDFVGAPFIFDPGINLISFFFSAFIGILFGFMPARRAASLDPIEALRHE